MNPHARFCSLFLLILFLFSCTSRQPEPTAGAGGLENKAASDSLTRLEVLVSARKASDNFQAQAYARQAYGFATQLKSAEAMVRACMLMGIAYNNYNNDSSFHYYSRALRLVTENHMNDYKPKIYYNMSQIYRAVYDMKMSVLFLDSSILLSSQNRDYAMLSNGYTALGNLKFDMLDSAHALVLFDSAFGIARRHGLSRQEGVAMANLAKFERNPAVSFRMQKHAIEMLKKQPGNEEEIALTHISLGLLSSNTDSAISHFRTAIETGRTGNSSEVQIAAYNNLAYSYLDKHDIKNAASCLVDFAIPLAKQTDNYDWLSTLYDSYTDVLLADDKIGQAFEYEREALKARRKADDKQANDQVRLLTSLLDLKNKELAIQVRESEIREKEGKIQRMSIWFSGSLGVLLVVIFLIIWIFQRNKIKYQQELLNAAKRLLEIEESMKGRVSMELHDLTTPFYTSMLHQIEKAQIRDQKVEVELKSRLSVLAESLRQISHQMNNSFLEQLTIAELVRGLCRDLNLVSKVPIRCVLERENFRLNGEETLHVYRIIQEMLTNAMKYVKSGEITISLSEEAKMFFILYQDSGSGFDMDKANSKGLGISNIFERAKIINGKAILNSFPGKGTKWTIFIPLKPEKRVQYEKALT